MMLYTFYVRGTFHVIGATTYQAACREFCRMTSRKILAESIVTSVQKVA